MMLSSLITLTLLEVQQIVTKEIDSSAVAPGFNSEKFKIFFAFGALMVSNAASQAEEGSCCAADIVQNNIKGKQMY